MTVLDGIKIPDSLMKHIRHLAESEGISVDQFIASAIAEKASAWDTMEYLEERAKRGSRDSFLKALSEVPDAEPDEWDGIE
jgi:hypothetical protein